MASSSSSSRRFDVFPSFSGEDVRRGFLSYLLKEFDRKSIISFIDHGIERSRSIGPELISAIRESKISIVIFSKNYASSSWCLNELVEIHKCSMELDQMVIPVFYYVDPSHVRKQTGEFGKIFEETCKGKPKDQKRRWMQALTDVANMAGEDLRNGPSEAHMVEKIANDVSNKLISRSNGFGDFVGIEAHIEAMNSILCLESEEVRMVGIWGQSGIGKSTIGRALFSHLSPKYPLRNFSTYKCTDQDISGKKLSWEQNFLSEILDQKDLKIENYGVVKERLKYKKVLIVLDDVESLEFLKTLVGETTWFGAGSRIIVITQDRHLLKAHKIDLVYEVKIPDEDLALKMLSRSAFGENSPPEGFKELAVKVVELAGNLPLGLSVLGSSLNGRTKQEWMELLPGLQSGLKGDIMKTLRVGYNRLDEKDQEIFLYIASLFNGGSVKFINDFFGDVNARLKRLAEKSLIRITPNENIVEMHNLLENLGRKIDYAESKGNPGKRRFLTDAKDILDVFNNQMGTETMLGISFNALSLPSQIKNPSFSINERSFEGMFNLQFLEIYNPYYFWPGNLPKLLLPNGLISLPRKLKLLDWNNCPLKCLPSSFKAEFLVELRMENNELEKLWEGTQQLGNLKKMKMRGSKYLKEIPDLSKAINLKKVDFSCCYKLEIFPSPLNSESLEYLNLLGCPLLGTFPQIIMQSFPHRIEIVVTDYLWNKNLFGLDYLNCLRRCNPSKFRPEHLVSLAVKGNTLEKLWEGVQSLGSLKWIDLSESENLKEIPDLSKATNLTYLYLSSCKSLVTLPSTIGNLQKLKVLEMKKCTGLEVLPVNVNLSSLKYFNLSGCSSLTSFPQISCSIKKLNLDDTAIEEVPCRVEMLWRLAKLSMRGCNKLKNISPNIFTLTYLKEVDFTDCGGVITALSDTTVVASIDGPYENIEERNNSGKRRTLDKDEDEDEHKDKDEDDDDYDHLFMSDSWYFNFQNCLKLDRDARELIIQSSFKSTMVLPCGEVPTYFKHRAYGNSLTVTLPQSSLSHNFLRFNVCVVVEHLTTRHASLYLEFRFNGKLYKHVLAERMTLMWTTDHLVVCSFKFQPASLPSKSDFSDVEFVFYSRGRIKECGIRLLNVFPSPDDRNGSSDDQNSKEKCDVVETERSKKRIKVRSKKRIKMISGKSEESLYLPCGQIVTDTEESSSVSSYPCLEGEALCVDSMITEQQDAQLSILKPRLVCYMKCA